MKDYGERDGTARTHAGEIQDAEGWRDFTEVASELSDWLDARAWITGDGPKALFDAAVGWLRERKVLLPGVTGWRGWWVRVGRRRVSDCGRRCKIFSTTTSAPRSMSCWRCPEENRTSRLDQLRRPPTRVSGPAMVDALQRAAEILGLGFAEVDTEVVPPRRLAELSRYGVQGWCDVRGGCPGRGV
uniref:DUF4158 domain-containing protein n=1 Tax=Saccharopolyspora karakumensis TaxID=2530386 RepID=UPI001A9EA362|nr:DUF4158 domain-containing protein [Saccharopolyspora karakumensis]